MGINGHHQRMTAVPEHTSMSFEESRLQYYKYNLNKQKGCFTSKATAFFVFESCSVYILPSYPLVLHGF
jgi:hypothetical protein